MSDDYEVGYGKPPRHSQFKPGQSGNRSGRPKGSKNLKTDLQEELSETMKVKEGGRERRISKQRALIKSQVARAITGNDRAAAKVLDLYLRVLLSDDQENATDEPPSQEERDVLKAIEARIRRRLNTPADADDGAQNEQL